MLIVNCCLLRVSCSVVLVVRRLLFVVCWLLFEVWRLVSACAWRSLFVVCVCVCSILSGVCLFMACCLLLVVW